MPASNSILLFGTYIFFENKMRLTARQLLIMENVLCELPDNHPGNSFAVRDQFTRLKSSPEFPFLGTLCSVHLFLPFLEEVLQTLAAGEGNT